MTRLTLLALLALAAGASSAFAQGKKTAQPADQPAAQTFADLLPKMATAEAQQKWQDVCSRAGAPGNEKLRAEVCKLMAGSLDAKTPNPARVWLLKQLERIGRDECVDALAAVLDDADDEVRDAAVRALANNPTPAATGKLTAKLSGATGKAKVGLLNALGHRGDTTAVAAVAKELAGTDTAAVVAAAGALGRIGTADAAAALAAVRTVSKDAARAAIDHAYLQCADRLLAAGKTTEAAAVYVVLNTPAEPRPVRLAALRGVIRTSGDAAGPMIVSILAGDDAAARAVAAAQIEGLSAAALKPLAAGFDKLPAPSRVAVLNALAARGEKSQAAVVAAAAGSKDAEVRRAAVRALGRLGDATAVAPLLDALAAGGLLGEAASESLAQLPGDGVNEKLLAALDAEKTPARVAALIGVVERRDVAAALPALLKATGHADAGVRTAAFSALRKLGEPKHIPDVAAAVLTAKGKDRDDAELTVVALAAKIPDADKRADAVLALFAASGKDQKATLLPLLGRLGGTRALAVVRESAAGTDPALSAAGVAALFNWPDAAPTDDLLKIAADTKDAGRQQQAIRALVRVTTLPGDRPAADRLPVMKKAMDLSTRDDERRVVLEGLGMVRHLDTLRYVLPYLDQKGLDQAACKAIVELAHSRMLREPNKPEFDKALDRVIALCKDKGLVERARQYKQAP